MSISRPDFNLIARPYRWLEYLTLGRALERCRLLFLPELLRQQHALVLGDGDGRFLAALLHQNPDLHAHAIDTSSVMLELLQQRCEAYASNTSSRLRIQHADALTAHLDKTYDLVVTHFFLDCLTQSDLEALIARIVPSLSPGAFWLISDFRIPTGPMQFPARIFIRTLYLVFRVLTGLRTIRLPDHVPTFQQAGLSRIDHHPRLAGLLSSELWQLTPTSLNSK